MRDAAGLDAQLGALLRDLGEDLGGVQHRLGRDAGVVEAAAAGLVALDDGGLLAELGGADRGDVAAGAAADHDHVVDRPSAFDSIRTGLGVSRAARSGIWIRAMRPDHEVEEGARDRQQRARCRATCGDVVAAGPGRAPQLRMTGQQRSGSRAPPSSAPSTSPRPSATAAAANDHQGQRARLLAVDLDRRDQRQHGRDGEDQRPGRAETTAADRDGGGPLALGERLQRRPRLGVALLGARLMRCWKLSAGASRAAVRAGASSWRGWRGGVGAAAPLALAALGRACARGCPSVARARRRRPRRRAARRARRRRRGSSASRIARTTQSRRAPAATTSATLPASMPPIANQGSVALSRRGLDQLEPGRGPSLLVGVSQIGPTLM